MQYTIDKKKEESAYLQLYHAIRKDIADKVLPIGTRLPSKRTMAQETGVSVITVEHAYQLLLDEGYILSRPKSGFYVDFTPQLIAPNEQTKIRKPAPIPITKAPEDFPFSVWAKTMRSVLATYDRRILIKAPGSGCPELKDAIAGYLGRSRGLKVDPEQIVIGAGAEYLYGLVVRLLGRDRIYALEDPSYEKIRRVYEMEGARVEMLEMGPDGIASYELMDTEAGVLHVTPFHSFPSGVTATAAKRHEYAAWAKARKAFIVEDDYDSEFASPTKQIETIYSLAKDHVIYINTFSKILAPSMRTGFMVLPETLCKPFHDTLDFYSCTVPVFDQYVLAAFIQEGHMERYINRRRRKLRMESQEA